MAERALEIKPQGREEKTYHFLSRGSEVSKKIDLFVFGGGAVIAIFNPVVGVAILGGNAVTYVGADEIQRRAKGRLNEMQGQRIAKQKELAIAA